ncbi:MAG: 2-polyprenyl-3-methyl-6-methoxy-1,4-benzoquinone monooxygenase [Betaproteobacteria bacterium]|jgi:ubiquinone biosynthesis monooxygenase Coq7|uniref:3-demethoxyubiquinol 3-hydroxylase n=1 Tax=Candidatus Proximibacter danicus TaxID=2954365 RepID=A0A9D7K181_9PROT|nr:2-polyprenyl-3-methyl-6-methoxy-1,4-benzoquinone monooxygenase [Candidatus Proximibacter danicus]MBK9444971.1 2-polyprenyl-3-methyl-6-methoxy-1,4-benzoquinone monooxygenase [Betaproteobacteria bacterium]
MNLDRLIVEFDKSLRTVFASSVSARPIPGDELPEAHLDPAERQHAAALMRVNHVGEVCAQALYQGQAIASSSVETRVELAKAAQEETEHLAWTEARIAALGGRKSFLNPVWYGGSLVLGMLAGHLGDAWSLGFLAETERQVGIHLDDHLGRLPAADEKSRQVLLQMQSDEAAHAAAAVQLGASELPVAARVVMQAASRVMTRTAYFI